MPPEPPPLPGLVDDNPLQQHSISRAEYITPFAVNATAACFRYDGRVAPHQLMRDGELVSVEKLKLDTFTQNFAICYSEAKGILRGLGEQLEEYRSQLKRHVEAMPPLLEKLMPVVLAHTGKRRPFTPSWVTGLPLRIAGISRIDAENLTCLLVRSFEEASLGLTALLLGQGDPTSIACTFSLCAEGFQEYACSTEEDDLDVTEKKLREQEKQLLLLGPLLSIRKAATGMLTPAEYKIFCFSLVVYIIKEKGKKKFFQIVNTKSLTKAKRRRIIFSTCSISRCQKRLEWTCMGSRRRGRPPC